MQGLIKDLQQQPSAHPQFTWADNQLRKGGRLVVGHVPALKSRIIHWLHSSPQGGHSGIQATLKRIRHLFYWPSMNQDVTSYIQQCLPCQQCKYDRDALPGLQPLPIPESVWEDVTMDFIEGLS